MKYRVSVREVHIQPYEIEADSETEAKDRVANSEGDLIEEEFEYSHVLDMDLWSVEEIRLTEPGG